MTTTDNNIKLIAWKSVASIGHMGWLFTTDKTAFSCHVTGKRGAWDAVVKIPTNSGLASLKANKTDVKGQFPTLEAAKAWCQAVIGAEVAA